MNINHIIKESINNYLFESLKTQKQKYGNELVNKLKDLDPSKTYKYIDLICKLYKEGISKEEIKKYIDILDDKLNRNLIPKEYKDINKIKDFDELKDILNNKSKETSNTEEKNKIRTSLKDIFYKEIKNSTGDWLIYRPVNTLQQILLGKGTKWCIAQTSSKNYFNDYFVLHNVRFYILINKDNPKEKYQIQVYPDNEKDIYDQLDYNVYPEEFEMNTGLDINDFNYYNVDHQDVYDKDGNKIGEVNNNKYTGVIYKYNGYGKLTSLVTFKDGKKDGFTVVFGGDNYIFIIETYKDDKLWGYNLIYKNGKLSSIQEYKNDDLNGWNVDMDGNYQVYYVNDIATNDEVMIYPDGRIEEMESIKPQRMKELKRILNKLNILMDGKEDNLEKILKQLKEMSK